MVARRYVVRAILCVASARCALYDDVSHVTEFTSSGDFEKTVLEDDASVWVVHFYQGGGGDKGSQAMAAEFGESTSELLGLLGVRAAAVDVAIGAVAKAAMRLDVVRVPTVMGFSTSASMNPHTGRTDRAAVLFENVLGGRDSESGSGFSKTAFKRWVSSKVMPSDLVVRVDSELALATLGAPLAVVLTERLTTSAFAKSIGVAFRGRLAVAEVHVSGDMSSLAATLSLPSETLPALRACASTSDAMTAYDGNIKDRMAAIAWLESFAHKDKAEL
jgi:hypothetical protein